MPNDQEGHFHRARPGDEPADVGGDVGRQGAGAGHPQAEADLDGKANVQHHLSQGTAFLGLFPCCLLCFFFLLFFALFLCFLSL